jgi:hypothetical protein
LHGKLYACQRSLTFHEDAFAGFFFPSMRLLLIGHLMSFYSFYL